MDIGALVVFWLICGVIAAAIGQKKNLSVGGCFALGAFLSIIGIAIVVAQKPGLPEAPHGMRAVRCPRCNAVQNVPEHQATFECWQCKLASDVASASSVGGPRGPQEPEDIRVWLDRKKKS